jgi:hypothetical protein
VVAPPRPDEAWTAEVAWDGAASRFAVRAAPWAGTTAAVVVAHTEVLRWPPPDAAAVQALADATRSIEAVLLASGWKPLPAGDAWWALRFAWVPASVAPEVADSLACTAGASAGPA